MFPCFDTRIYLILMWFQTVKCMSLINQHSYFMDNSGLENDVADLIVSKGYLPNDKDMPKTSIVKNVGEHRLYRSLYGRMVEVKWTNVGSGGPDHYDFCNMSKNTIHQTFGYILTQDNDVTYLLSKLSDEELVKILNEQPQKNIYDLSDIVKLAVDPKDLPSKNKLITPLDLDKNEPTLNLFTHQHQISNKRFKTVPSPEKSQAQAFFRLNDKPVETYSIKKESDTEYAALQKLNSLLYSRPQEEERSEEEEDAKKELLFDILVAQLRALCCKRRQSVKKQEQSQYKKLMTQILSQADTNFKASNILVPEQKLTAPSRLYDKGPNEFMFLIINDEIKSNASEELISVDPDSLEKNSSVLLLGPISTPLTDTQLKAVMNRISTELSKADYLPLLQQLADGTLSENNIRLMKSLVTGPETRRYIKPHRCNHQAPSTRVYGGPKWIICTGYLNLNIPSLYD